jgi:pimeloyl-ACP methyl ester carboxylesterase
MQEVTVGGRRVGYAEYGSGDRVVVLLHALLQSHRMQAAIAEGLAERGRRAICLNLLAEREEGEHLDPWRFASAELARQALAALDVLGVERAVFMGTSVGGCVALECALAQPERVQGLVIEGPFLDNAAHATALAWSGIYGAFTVARPLLRAVALAGRLVPAGTSVTTDMLRHNLTQDPVRARAFLQGITFGRTGPPRDERMTIQAPALVIGFPIDPFHPMSDAELLVEELRDARLVRTRSIADLRRRNDDLVGEITRFCGDCDRRAAAAEEKAA